MRTIKIGAYTVDLYAQELANGRWASRANVMWEDGGSHVEEPQSYDLEHDSEAEAVEHAETQIRSRFQS